MKHLSDSDKRRIRVLAIRTVQARYLRRKEFNMRVNPGNIRDNLIRMGSRNITRHHSWITKIREYLLSLGSTDTTSDALISINPKGMGLKEPTSDEFMCTVYDRFEEVAVRRNESTTGIPFITLFSESRRTLEARSRAALYTGEHDQPIPALNFMSEYSFKEDVVKCFDAMCAYAQQQPEEIREYMTANAMRYMLHHMTYWVMETALSKGGIPRRQRTLI